MYPEGKKTWWSSADPDQNDGGTRWRQDEPDQVTTIPRRPNSLDNAIVNAAILKDMEPKWQRRFITWGVLVAVFGMRIVFPLAIVSVSALVSPVEAVRIALFEHVRYEAIVTGAHVGISGFGGALLMLRAAPIDVHVPEPVAIESLPVLLPLLDGWDRP